MDAKFKQYETTPGWRWSELRDEGYDGYDIMAAMTEEGWRAISSWGKDGWDMGSWPYVVVYFKDYDSPTGYTILVYVEGDVEQWTCPSKEIRNQIADELAFFYWKTHGDEWVKDYKTIDDVPANSDLRGPARWWKESKDNEGN